MQQKYDIRPNQSIELLKKLHILTIDGKLNQDSRRKLKQIYHLYNFIEPILNEVYQNNPNFMLCDHGAGKSYLGFILYDLFFKQLSNTPSIISIENRKELVLSSMQLAQKLQFKNMRFYDLNIKDSITSSLIPNKVEIVTALHACNTATDDAIDFALNKDADYIILIPCCQAQVASVLKKHKPTSENDTYLYQLWKNPIHSREFGSHLTNVLRVLRLEAHGYNVTVTELVGFEHSMKNELIIAKKTNRDTATAKQNLEELINKFGLMEIKSTFIK